jgi:DNA-binding beta-propeller fold protein YncE
LNSFGRYQNSLGSVHYHLEFSRFLALDAQKRILFSHPGDYYDPRHSVRLADASLAPLLEFGQQGSGPGQFETPTGVAFWGPQCTVEGPLVEDSFTLLLLHLDGSLEGVDGEVGTGQGIAFVDGRYDQGVAIADSDTLTYPTDGNLNKLIGAIEFWIKPSWDGDDNQNYVFFEAGSEWFNRLRIMKDGANNLRFMLWDADQEFSANTQIADWQAGVWHHVAATWDEDAIAIYVDGELKDQVPAIPPEVLEEVMYIGSLSNGDFQAEAVIDELRISNTWRVGNSEKCLRYLVADSGNDRLQVFDRYGNFLLAYGSTGSALGQFDDPQGLVVDELGRLIVVDRGNDRLQVLAFDGVQFNPLLSITAGFTGPVGVAVRGDQVYLADTGNDRIVVLKWTPQNQLVFEKEYTAPNDGYLGDFLRPEGLAVGADGTIYVADTGNLRVVRILGIYRTFLPTTHKK